MRRPEILLPACHAKFEHSSISVGHQPPATSLSTMPHGEVLRKRGPPIKRQGLLRTQTRPHRARESTHQVASAAERDGVAASNHVGVDWGLVSPWQQPPAASVMLTMLGFLRQAALTDGFYTTLPRSTLHYTTSPRYFLCLRLRRALTVFQNPWPPSPNPESWALQHHPVASTKQKLPSQPNYIHWARAAMANGRDAPRSW